MTYLLVGLGNPGDDYKLTRHNAGFLAIDKLAKQFDLTKKGKKFKSIVYEGLINDHKIFAIKPQTYMNLSGEAVQLISSFYKIPADKIIVLYDDFEFDFGKLRLREQGSAGTHNGMKSIIQCLSTQTFKRIRIGIGPKPEEQAADKFVLATFNSTEQDQLRDYLNRISTATQNALDDFKAAMNQWN